MQSKGFFREGRVYRSDREKKSAKLPKGCEVRSDKHTHTTSSFSFLFACLGRRQKGKVGNRRTAQGPAGPHTILVSLRQIQIGSASVLNFMISSAGLDTDIPRCIGEEL